jgi:hypothetical protein
MTADVDLVSTSELVAMKVLSLAQRAAKEKGTSDRLDVHRLLNAFSELREAGGTVASRLKALGADEATLGLWRQLVQERVEPDDDDGY